MVQILIGAGVIFLVILVIVILSGIRFIPKTGLA
jgi:hypothetical protein